MSIGRIFPIISGNFNVEGNPKTLISKDGIVENLPPSAFMSLFSNDTQNAYALKSASKLVLDSDELSEYCYCYMFIGQKSLTEPPALPATKLAKRCYNSMFQECSFTKAPTIPSVDFAESSLRQAFRHITTLSSVTVEFASWPEGDPETSSYPTYHWLQNVAPSGNFICPSALEYRTGDSYIPSGWLVNGVTP